ncbi:Mu transposase C-terminal domain-containing protein [Oceanibaculum indicum]|uniref:Mu transposase C-terminal domain-containing protein n=1 Tax=Oceanibaculum indicum TaxID=526216 RepID=UPI0002DDB965|nr:Mu transposase C-terminal domain-containing protein [Oceanibaculum indicum]
MKAEWFTAAELARLALPGLPGTRQNIASRAKRENWRSRERKASGGGIEYHVSSLPQPAREVLAARAAAEAAKQAPALPAPAPAKAARPDPRYLTGKGQLRLDAKLAILAAWDAFWPPCGLGLVQAQHKFVGLYNATEIAVEGWVRDTERTISFASLRRWIARREEGNINQLAGRYKGQAGRSTLGLASEVKAALGGILAQQPMLSAGTVRDQLRQRFGETIQIEIDGQPEERPLPSLRQIQREIAAWRQQNSQALAAVSDPDGWKNHHMVAVGSASEGIVRPNQLWEIDASPADMICVDGRWSIYVAIDVYTRRLLVYISRTPRTEAALLLIRRAILAWGVPETIRTDQGSDFTSAIMRRALALLQIRHDAAPPFSPERKAFVERHIGFLQHDLMPMLPGFVGHSVADRKKIEGRRSFAQRLGESPEKLLQVSMTGEELQEVCDYWAGTQYEHRPHGGLEGRSPAEKLAHYTGDLPRIGNERALDLLLAPAPAGDGQRAVTKKGIKVEGTWFWSDALIPWVGTGERFDIRLDPEDMGRIYVYRAEPWEFVCVAIDPDRLGLDRRQIAVQAKTAQKAWVKERRAELLRAGKQFQPHHMAAALLGTAPAGPIAYTTPALEAAANAAGPERQAPADPIVIRDLTPDMEEAAAKRFHDIESRAGSTSSSDSAPAITPASNPVQSTASEPAYAGHRRYVPTGLSLAQTEDLAWALWMLEDEARGTPKQRQALTEMLARRSFRQLVETLAEQMPTTGGEITKQTA